MSFSGCKSNKNSAFGSVFSNVIQSLQEGVGETRISGLKGSSASFLISFLRQETKRNFLIITPTFKEAEECYQELLFFSGEEGDHSSSHISFESLAVVK